ncbi:MAG: hypothetical protein QOH31_2223 [Verrucomicrobiota bacterium]
MTSGSGATAGRSSHYKEDRARSADRVARNVAALGAAKQAQRVNVSETYCL